ncbi:thioredoxin-like protein [Suillus subalutaceus]|uniref:thioredoxin-like protein n=1 Tax=Suillus subalutaceus TaxID=48586 RepID=UPI001B8803F2|nr:thioredoxin-like protein [Suillus subalutaceus]KAG1840278.1 thioredoxin-like protein [Suillus subalutaceus]
MPFNPIDDAQDFTRIINSGKTVLIDFHADWSGLCRSTSQQFSELSDTFVRIGVDFYRVNVDELEDVVMEADVRVVPTYMVFKDGKKVGHATGADALSLHKLMGSYMTECEVVA